MNKAENNNNKKMYISPIAENKKYIIYRTLIASSFNETIPLVPEIPQKARNLLQLVKSKVHQSDKL